MKNMNKIFIIITLILITALSGFTQTISPTSLSYASPATAGQVITITSTQAWAITAKPTWVNVSGISGTGNGSFTITTVSNNPSLTTSRSGNITIAFNSTSIDIPVTQTASPATITLSEYTNNIVWYTAGYSVTLTSNANWSAVATSTGNWLRFDPSSYGTTNFTGFTGTTNLAYYVDNNNTGSSRTGHITITAGVTTVTLTVIQDFYVSYLTSASTSLVFDSNATDIINGSVYTNKVQVSSNTNWYMNVTNGSWLNIENTSGTSLAGISFTNDTILWVRTASNNTSTTDRTATITLSSGSLSDVVINVTQKAHTATIPITTGLLNSTLNQNEIIVYPNPSTGIVNIDSKTAVSIKIYDTMGNISYAGKASITHLIELPKGMYFLEATNEMGSKTIQKIIAE
jgi:hypothetical protein